MKRLIWSCDEERREKERQRAPEKKKTEKRSTTKKKQTREEPRKERQEVSWCLSSFLPTLSPKTILTIVKQFITVLQQWRIQTILYIFKTVYIMSFMIVHIQFAPHTSWHRYFRAIFFQGRVKGSTSTEKWLPSKLSQRFCIVNLETW